MPTIVEGLYADPGSPATGQAWLRLDLVAGWAPAAPTGHSVDAGDTLITLHPGTATAADSYNAYYTSNGTTPTTGSTKITGVTNNQQLTGLSNGTAYKFKFEAVGELGNASPLSTEVSATPGGGDVTAPVVTVFTVPATSTSLTVAITTLTATDAVGVVGWIITESATPPAHNAAGWNAVSSTTSFTSAALTYVCAENGRKTLYAYAKDAANNVSSGVSGVCDVSAAFTNGFTDALTITSNVITGDPYLTSMVDGGTVTQATGAGGTPSATGRLILASNTANTNKSAVILRGPALPMTRTIEMLTVIDAAANSDVMPLGVVNDTAANVLAGTLTRLAIRVLCYNATTNGNIGLWYKNSAGTAYWWVGSAWQTTQGFAYSKGSTLVGTYYKYKLVTSATHWKLQIYSAADALLGETALVAWADTYNDGTNPFYVMGGDMSTSQQNTQTIDAITVS